MQFQKFNHVPGALNHRIDDIIQDKTGFIWYITEYSIQRFDGHEFVSYTKTNQFKKGTIFNALYLDLNDNLWITTNNGLYRYNHLQDNFIHYPLPVSPNASYISKVASRLVQSPVDSAYYVNAENGVIYKFTPGGEFTVILDLQIEGCKNMALDKDGNLWIAANGKLFKYNLKTKYTSLINLSRQNENEYQIYDMLFKDSMLYIASSKSGLIVYNLINNAFERPLKFSSKNSYTLLDDKSGALWVGTSEGLDHHDLVSNKLYTYKPDIYNIKSLSSASITKLFRDRQNNLWIGTEEGLNLAYSSNKFQPYGFKFGNLGYDKNVTSILINKRGEIILGFAEGGISIFDENYKEKYGIFSSSDLKPDPDISSIVTFLEDAEENLWIGTYAHGLLKYNYNDPRFVQFHKGDGESALGSDFIRSIAEDPDGNLWLATMGGGLVSFNPENQRFQSFVIKNGLPEPFTNKWSFDVIFDTKGQLWAGFTTGAACLNIATGEYIIYHQEATANRQISNNYVKQIFEDSSGRIWLGTAYGLNIIFPDQTLHQVTTENGLSDNNIRSIVEDINGIIWVGTANGLSKVEVISPDSFAIEAFYMEDGLHNNNFLENSMAVSPTGNVYIGGIGGFTVFYPDSIKSNRLPPEPVFTDFSLFNESVPVQSGPTDQETDKFYLDRHLNHLDQLVLKESQNVIGFSFAALNYINYSKNQYAYKLEGFDKNWTNSGNRNTVTYTNLNPGDYVFKVKAANNDGVWSTNERTLAIKVLPPIWKSKAAFLVYLLIVVGISILILRLYKEKVRTKLQIEQKEILNTMKTQFFVNASHEIKTPLTLIATPLQRIIDRSKDAPVLTINRNDINSIYRNVKRLLRLVNQIFDFRKIELNKMTLRTAKYNLTPFIYSVIENFDYQLKARQVKIKMNYDKHTDYSFYFDPDKMDKVLFNLISNALKYSPENSEIIINVYKTKDNKLQKKVDDYICIDFIDQGPGIAREDKERIFERFYTQQKGFSYDNEGSGIGLSIVKEYTTLHHGEISVISPHDQSLGTERQGTKVTLKFPLDDSYLTPEEKTEDTLRHEEIMLENRQMAVNWNVPEKNVHIESEKTKASSGHKILLIEDDIDLLLYIKSELTVFHEVLEAKNGNTGIRIAKELMPDLIICDIMMPGINGFEVVSQLKNAQETSHIPIILLTAKVSENDETEGYSYGADAFMRKPFGIKPLLSLIDSLIENRIKLKQGFLANYGINLHEVLPSSTDEKFMENLLQLIHKNIADPNLGIETFTKELGMSRAQLYKKVGAITNTSVKLFIRKVRLQKASDLILSKAYNITEVAYMVGFDNLPYFSKCFHEEFGVSPSRYATKQNGNIH
ncbi:MAG: two-component regulator propeller domain-containing protein [Bacteroidota bacterium]